MDELSEMERTDLGEPEHAARASKGTWGIVAAVVAAVAGAVFAVFRVRARRHQTPATMA